MYLTLFRIRTQYTNYPHPIIWQWHSRTCQAHSSKTPYFALCHPSDRCAGGVAHKIWLYLAPFSSVPPVPLLSIYNISDIYTIPQCGVIYPLCIPAGGVYIGKSLAQLAHFTFTAWLSHKTCATPLAHVPLLLTDLWHNIPLFSVFHVSRETT